MLLFVDESGTDHRQTPYEVLAGVAIPIRDLWNLIQAIRSAERDTFGLTLSQAGIEMKGSKLLDRKVFSFAGQAHPLPADHRRELCREFLLKGVREQAGGPREPRTRNEFTAYGQSCLAFTEQVLTLCSQYRAKVFASVVSPAACLAADAGILRRDYVVLFRRYANYVRSLGEDKAGVIIFDELDKRQSAQLLQQMSNYFLRSAEGRVNSSVVVPEPFFVHSDLTTAIGLADLMAYILNWGFRLPRMTEPRREEIRPFADLVYSISYRGSYAMEDETQRILYGICYIEDLVNDLAPEGSDVQQ